MSTIKIKGEFAEVSLTNYHEPAIIDASMVGRVEKCKSGMSSSTRREKWNQFKAISPELVGSSWRGGLCKKS
jgi:hypothetical protein